MIHVALRVPAHVTVLRSAYVLLYVWQVILAFIDYRPEKIVPTFLLHPCKQRFPLNKLLLMMFIYIEHIYFYALINSLQTLRMISSVAANQLPLWCVCTVCTCRLLLPRGDAGAAWRQVCATHTVS